MAQQFLLRGATLEDASRQASELYGPSARIVRAERVLDGGLGGFLGRRHIEVTVHIPDDGDPAVVAVEPAVPHVLSGRAGIAALLDDADRAEDEFRSAAPSVSPDDSAAVGLAGLGSPAVGSPAVGSAVVGSAGDRSAAAGAAVGAPATGAPAVSTQAVSTQAVGFDELLERLRSEVVLETRVPAVLSAPGDLVLVAGLGDTAFGVARDMARDGSRWELWNATTEPADLEGRGPELSAGELARVERAGIGSGARLPAGAGAFRSAHAAGSYPGAADLSPSEVEGLGPGNGGVGGLRFGRRRLGGAPLGSRRDAEAARARGVETETAAVVACSLGSVAEGLPLLGLACELGADQVWLVVDARHKVDETAEWVAAACARLPVDALAVVGAGETRSASSVNTLGFPVGWVDGSPAPRTVL